MTLAASGCLGGGGGGEATPIRNGSGSNNRAPRIGGTAPPGIVPGEFYDFRPSASDPDGDRLVFSIVNKPHWARFDHRTGRLTGSPGERSIGLYTGISIVVSDGRASSALPTFDIAVTHSAPGMVTLSWMPPTQNEDGSALHDLAGYRIYVGRQPHRLSRVIVLNNPGLTRYVVENLSPATWFFAMTSYNRQGDESRRSATVRKRIG